MRNRREDLNRAVAAYNDQTSVEMLKVTYGDAWVRQREQRKRRMAQVR